jgi:hypothetical protein
MDGIHKYLSYCAFASNCSAGFDMDSKSARKAANAEVHFFEPYVNAALSPDWAERILSWPHSGFNVHSLVRTRTKIEAERVGKYMIRPLLSLERLSFLEPEGKVGYRHGRGSASQSSMRPSNQGTAEQETMDYLEFIARVTSHIPDKGQVMVRYFGVYSNAHRGKVRKAGLAAFPLRIVEEKLPRIPSKGWAAMIRKVYEVDPMLCPKCGGTMKIVAFLTEHAVVDGIIEHLKLRFIAEKPPPSRIPEQVALLFLTSSNPRFMLTCGDEMGKRHEIGPASGRSRKRNSYPKAGGSEAVIPKW